MGRSLGWHRVAAIFALTVVVSACATAGAPGARLDVAFSDPVWTGVAIPPGMQCARQGGDKPASPGLKISGIPEGTVRLVLEFNDESFQPLSYDGGHGKFAFAVAGRREVAVPPIPVNVDRALPAGVSLIASHRAGGGGGRGYLAPCSGRGNTYSLTIRALSEGTAELARGYIVLGRY